ncbi:hypothetical protein [Neorhizobium tomejilense]|jgi:hypothetical protein|uniref:hypothetical protein n=1 Tax=Neorhizobium tomejilense TaxID=2093828 RepID=UPI003ECCF023
MADQTVKIANDAGSNCRVAFDLMEKVMFRDKTETYTNKKDIINLYVDCLLATYQNKL